MSASVKTFLTIHMPQFSIISLFGTNLSTLHYDYICINGSFITLNLESKDHMQLYFYPSLPCSATNTQKAVCNC